MKKESISTDICLGLEALEMRTGMPVTLIKRLIDLGLPHFQLANDGKYVFHLRSVSEWIYLKTKEQNRPIARERRGDNPSVW